MNTDNILFQADEWFDATDRLTALTINNQRITDKSKPKLAAIDAALRNLTMYLSSRHNGQFHSLWHSSREHNIDRVFICEWRNAEPKMLASPRVVTLKEVLDLIERHTVYMPAIALDGDRHNR